MSTKSARIIGGAAAGVYWVAGAANGPMGKSTMEQSTAAQPRGDVYHLSYRWVIDGPIDVVYYFVSHGRTYPEWFPVFRDAQSDDAEVRIGARVRYHVKALLPYHLYWEVRLTQLGPPPLGETARTAPRGSW